ncbi:MAG: prephenate dehydrogenase [Bacteroidetes bacterium]|nr:MAG: prephenate dehydrogenase [Bacteroidota bacterium]
MHRRTMNITIIGLGVIGGSLARAVKQSVPRATVTGFDRPAVTAQALRTGAVDLGAASVGAAVHDADIVFLCLPVPSIIALLPDVARHCRRDAIVTDVGSTKGNVMAAAAKAFRSGGTFVGGHPMAGSEGKGLAFADPLLFQNATYVLCASPSRRRRIAPLTRLLHAIGARVLFLPPKRHDEVAALISHLPQLIAVGMMTTAGERNRTLPAVLQLAAGGFRDITRIASSPYGMWSGILEGNADEIRKALRGFGRLMTRYERDLRSGSGRARFAGRFSAAKKWRDAIPKNSKGFLHPLHELYVAVEDKPGVLAKMTAALFRAGINIKDIELLKIRDGRGGTFRLSFETKREADRAAAVLRVPNAR